LPWVGTIFAELYFAEHIRVAPDQESRRVFQRLTNPVLQNKKRVFPLPIFPFDFCSDLQPVCELQRPKNMQEGISVPAISNLALILALVLYGVQLFKDCFLERRWARSVTALLGGTGLLFLAFALIFTPTNAAATIYVAQAAIWRVLLAFSTTFLLAAIISFGVITYTKPLRLWHERRVERRLNGEVGKVP
jgi:hypothetical protein